MTTTDSEKQNGSTEAKRAAVPGSASLANDVARCDGSSNVEDGVRYWREGCETCLRRTAPRPERVWMIAPPAIVAFECEYLIEPNAEPSNGHPNNPKE